MLALIGNLSFGEFLLIAMVSVLVFGGRLPQVAARILHTFRQLRRSLDDLKRETGIDRELRNIEYEIRDAKRTARGSNPFAAQPPPGLRQARGGDGAASTPPRSTPGEAGAVEGEGEGGPSGLPGAPESGAGPGERPAGSAEPASGAERAEDPPGEDPPGEGPPDEAPPRT